RAASAVRALVDDPLLASAGGVADEAVEGVATQRVEGVARPDVEADRELVADRAARGLDLRRGPRADLVGGDDEVEVPLRLLQGEKAEGIPRPRGYAAGFSAAAVVEERAGDEPEGRLRLAARCREPQHGRGRGGIAVLGVAP